MTHNYLLIILGLPPPPEVDAGLLNFSKLLLEGCHYGCHYEAWPL